MTTTTTIPRSCANCGAGVEFITDPEHVWVHVATGSALCVETVTHVEGTRLVIPSARPADVIAVDSTQGGRPFCYFCVGCGAHEHTADGKAYFYRDECDVQQFVCWDCARTDKNPNYARAWLDGKTLPTIKRNDPADD